MKKFLLLLIATILLVACHQQKEYPEQLVRADSIMAAYPDSALALLRVCEDSIEQMDKDTRMYYTLLLTLAKDKCWQTHEADTLMPEVIEYYESQGDNKKLSWAYYTLGRIYDDMRNYPKALDLYQKSIDKGQETEDLRLIGLAYSQIGVIYHYNHMYDEMVDAYRKSYECALQAKDTLAMACRMTNMARVYTILNNVDSTLYYYNKSYELDHDPTTKSAIADIYIQIEEYGKAYEALCYNREAYTYWAEYYNAIGLSDSTIYYYEKALETGDIYSKLEATHNLAEKAENSGNLSAAMQYVKKEKEYQDSLDNVTKVAELKRVETQSKMEKMERTKLNLEAENRLVWIMLLAALSFILLASLIIYRRYKLITERGEQAMRFVTMKEMSAIEVSTKEISGCNRVISCIKKDKERFAICNTILSGIANVDFVLHESDWSKLEEEINTVFPSFTHKLQLLCPSIKEKEVCVCCLMMLDLKSKDIAHTICMSNNGLSTLQMRLYKKLTGNDGKARELKDVLSGML